MGTLAKRTILTLAVLGLAATSCTTGGDSDGAADGPGATTPAPATTTTAPEEVIVWPEPTFVAGECPMELTDEVIAEVTCGTVAVPENRTDPDSNMIELAVAKLHSTADDPRDDPVVQLEGGPGFGSLADVAGYSQSTMLDERDYYLWDQRGTGFSTPSLDCTEANEATWAMFSTTDDTKTEGGRVEDAMRGCRTRLQGDGIDLNGYNTRENAADLADLRVALGIDEWNLRGVSYGSALAMETIRSHPEGLHAVLLDSIVVPDEPFGAVARGEGALRSFDELTKACADDAACDDTYGPIDELMADAAAALDETPYEGTVTDPATGEDRPVAITGEDMYAGLFRAMYDEEIIPALPLALKAVAGGDYAIIEQLAQESIPFVTDQVEGMTTSVDCADRLPLLDPDSLEPFVEAHAELGALVYVGAPETGCTEWGVEATGGDFNTLLQDDDVDVPVMVMAGRFDPVTPPAGTKRVADALGVERLYFPNAGHGGVGSSDCARELWIAFMDDPSQYPDTACMDDLGPPEFA